MTMWLFNRCWRISPGIIAFPNRNGQPAGFAAVGSASSSEKPIHPGLSSHYGVAAGAGAGELKLNCTDGGFSAPGCALKNGFGGKPSMPANKTVGKLRTATL